MKVLYSLSTNLIALSITTHEPYSFYWWATFVGILMFNVTTLAMYEKILNNKKED